LRQSTSRAELGLAYQGTLIDAGPVGQHGVTAFSGIALPGDGRVRFAAWASAEVRAAGRQLWPTS